MWLCRGCKAADNAYETEEYFSVCFLATQESASAVRILCRLFWERRRQLVWSFDGKPGPVMRSGMMMMMLLIKQLHMMYM